MCGENIFPSKIWGLENEDVNLITQYDNEAPLLKDRPIKVILNEVNNKTPSLKDRPIEVVLNEINNKIIGVVLDKYSGKTIAIIIDEEKKNQLKILFNEVSDINYFREPSIYKKEFVNKMIDYYTQQLNICLNKKSYHQQARIKEINIKDNNISFIMEPPPPICYSDDPILDAFIKELVIMTDKVAKRVNFDTDKKGLLEVSEIK